MNLATTMLGQRPPTRTERPERPTATERVNGTERTPSVEDPSRASESESARDADAAHRTRRDSFAAMLALLAGSGRSARADLMRQVPDGQQALLDRLLNGAELPAGVDPAALVPTETGTDGAAAEALRFGLLQDAGALLEARNGRALGPVDDQRPTPGLPGLRGLARAAQQSPATDVLARIAERRGASLEQLMALGDTDAADARAALEALLAQAGTPAGTALAEAHASAFTNDGVTVAAAQAAQLAAQSAQAAALATALAASAADPGTPVRDTAALDPELQQRLTRVIDRMRQEYGHEVQVVETVRSGERQDHLYAQGRSRPGPVVTWTQESAHEHGAAVDVIIDGTWDNAAGFARLQRIAKEEGLRTLGLRDPGHLELPRELRGGIGATVSAAATAFAATRAAPHAAVPAATPATDPGGQMMSGIARVAGVANVAGVAGVASPTGPAPARSAGGEAAPRVMAMAVPTAAGPSGTTADSRDTGSAAQGRTRGDGRADARTAMDTVRDQRDDARAAYVERGARAEDMTPAHTAVPAADVSATTRGVAGGERPAVTGADAAQRVGDLQDARDAQPARPVSQLTLEVDAPDGGVDRVTVDLRGRAVGTHISTDAVNADRLRAHTAELQDALSRHGLESDSVRIRGTARATDAESVRQAITGEREASRITGAATAQGGDGLGQQPQGQRERPGAGRDFLSQDDARQAREEQAARRDAQQQSPSRQQDPQRQGADRSVGGRTTRQEA